MSESLKSILDRSALRRLAGSRSFERGSAYFAEGLVRGLFEQDGVVSNFMKLLDGVGWGG